MLRPLWPVLYNISNCLGRKVEDTWHGAGPQRGNGRNATPGVPAGGALASGSISVTYQLEAMSLSFSFLPDTVKITLLPQTSTSFALSGRGGPFVSGQEAGCCNDPVSRIRRQRGWSALSPGTNDLTSPSLSFLICEVGIISTTVTSFQNCEDKASQVCEGGP